MGTEFIHADLRNLHYVAWLRFLAAGESWSAEQIATYQLRELQRIVQYAYENAVGFHRICEQAGVCPDDVRSLEDLKKLPFMEKAMVRDHLEDFSTPVEGRFYITTGGSTGIPCGMYRDPISFGKELASKAHQYHRVGWREGSRQLVFRGLQITSSDHVEFFPEFNELRCSTYEFVPEWMEAYRQRALAYQPEWIRCYPSSGYVFAKYLKETQKDFPPVKGVLCSSEQLYPFQKRLLSEVFKGRIFSHYGHYEMAVLAGFCEHADTYHVLPQYGYAELIGGDGKSVTQSGEVGEIVGTSFLMHATPFIRYRTQDLAVFKGMGCQACGRPYPIWERVEGRLQELVVTRSGRYLSTSMLNMHNEFYDQIFQFQFHQKEPGRLTFKYVPKPSCTPAILQAMHACLLDRLTRDVVLEMRSVKEIPLTQRGKQRLLVQEVPLPYDDPALRESLSL